MKALCLLLAAVSAQAAPRAAARSAPLSLGTAPALWAPAAMASPAPSILAPALPALSPAPAALSLAAVLPAAAAPSAPTPQALLASMAAAPAAETHAAPGAAFDGSVPLAPADGASGALMDAAIDAARGSSIGTVHELSFRPSPGSLKRMAAIDGFEVLVVRRRGAGWILIKGGTGHVPAIEGDFDAYIHNHYYHPVLAKSFTPYPSDGDLVFSAGKDARFLVVSERGVVEWSPRVPYYPYARGKLTPEQRERMLDPKADENHRWQSRFRSGNYRRAALNFILPAFYGSLLAASGIIFKLRRWSDKALTQDFVDS